MAWRRAVYRMPARARGKTCGRRVRSRSCTRPSARTGPRTALQRSILRKLVGLCSGFLAQISRRKRRAKRRVHAERDAPTPVLTPPVVPGASGTHANGCCADVHGLWELHAPADRQTMHAVTLSGSIGWRADCTLVLKQVSVLERESRQPYANKGYDGYDDEGWWLHQGVGEGPVHIRAATPMVW
jgi:hypothetical protein